MGARLLVILIVAIGTIAIIAGGLALAGSGDEDIGATPSPTAASPSPTTAPPQATPTLPAPAPTATTSDPVQPDPGSPPAASPQPALPGADLPNLPADRKRVAAPIDGLDVRVLESFPPQYSLHVQAGLPSGCAEEAGYEGKRSGDVIEISVYNSLPTAEVVCTAIYGMYEINISLGSDFTSGQTYTVLVNDQRVTFTAQ